MLFECEKSGQKYQEVYVCSEQCGIPRKDRTTDRQREEERKRGEIKEGNPAIVTKVIITAVVIVTGRSCC